MKNIDYQIKFEFIRMSTTSSTVRKAAVIALIIGYYCASIATVGFMSGSEQQ